MKQFTVEIQKKDNTLKLVDVWVDDETARVLETLDENMRQKYLTMEHQMDLSDLRETRRHQSLNVSMDAGWDVADETIKIDEGLMTDAIKQELLEAISTLEPEQRWLVEQVYFKTRKQTEIAEEMGVKKTAINNRLERIKRKLKKNLN